MKELLKWSTYCKTDDSMADVFTEALGGQVFK